MAEAAVPLNSVSTFDLPSAGNPLIVTGPTRLRSTPVSSLSAASCCLEVSSFSLALENLAM
jgi:hypothetical protein